MLVFPIAFIGVGILNDDIYGRLTETATIPDKGHDQGGRRELPKLRLIVHKLLSDETAAEVSLVAISARSFAEKNKLVGYMHDGSSLHPYELGTAVALDATAGEPGDVYVAAQSPRFQVSVMPSVSGFPFDDVGLRIVVSLKGADYGFVPWDLEVQKMVPGRRLKVAGDTKITQITLTRTNSEKGLVVASAAVFVTLSVLLAILLFRSSTRLRAIEELLAVAGYIVAMAGFREVLGVSRVSGTSFLEIVIIGVPLVALSIGFGVSALRGLRAAPMDKGQ